MTTKPIKRSKALVRFSQEHHYNLLLVWQIKEGLRNSIKAERISDFVLFFFDQELDSHSRMRSWICLIRYPLRIQCW